MCVSRATKCVIDYYLRFLAELHEPVMWSGNRIPNKFSGVKKINKCITPPIMTEERARIEGFWWFKNLLNIFCIAENQGIVRDIVVHGSYGDFSMTRFSDIEMTIYIDESVFHDFSKKKLLSRWIKKHLNKLIVRVDPIQHHGAFYVWPGLLRKYSELILPCCAYNSCWSLRGEKLDFLAIDDVNYLRKESVLKLKSTLRKLSHPELSFFRLGLNDYSMKRYLSNLMLVPAFYYQSKGELVSKKDAIVRFIDEFPNGFTESLLKAGEAREHWSGQYRFLRFIRPIFFSREIPQGRLDLIFLAAFSYSGNKNFENYELSAAKENSKDFLELVCENF